MHIFKPQQDQCAECGHRACDELTQKARVWKFRLVLRTASTILAFICLVSPLVAQQTTSSEHILTPSEVKEYLKAASTPEDHLKIAAYFRHEAQQEEEAASLHEELAGMYLDAHMPPGMKHSSASDSAGHCKYFAKLARKAAANDVKLADYHQQWAEAMRNAPPSHGYHR